MPTGGDSDLHALGEAGKGLGGHHLDGGLTSLLPPQELPPRRVEFRVRGQHPQGPSPWLDPRD